MESHQLMSLSFQKLNSKCQKNGSDLRKNLLVFTVITACRTHKQDQQKQRKGKRKLETNDEQPPAKQQLCSFESAFCSISSKDEEVEDPCDASYDESSFPTQVPLSSFFLCCDNSNADPYLESVESGTSTEDLLKEFSCYSNTSSDERTIATIPQYLPVAAY